MDMFTQRPLRFPEALSTTHPADIVPTRRSCISCPFQLLFVYLNRALTRDSGILAASIDASIVAGCIFGRQWLNNIGACSKVRVVQCLDPSSSSDQVPQCLLTAFLSLVVSAFFIVIVMLGFISANAVQSNIYPHVCQNDWLQITLLGHDYKHTQGRNIATFSFVETGETLFTFTSYDPNQYEFKLAGLNSTAPIRVLPSLSAVTYNSTTNHITGTCYNSTDTCVTGYVWPYDGLEFGTSYNGTTSISRSLYNNWSFGRVPSVIMYRTEPDGSRGERILQTTFVNPGSCAEQKLCVAHAAQTSGRHDPQSGDTHPGRLDSR